MKKQIALTVALAGTFYIGKKLLEDKKDKEKETIENEISKLKIIKEYENLQKEINETLSIFKEIKKENISKEESQELENISFKLRRVLGSRISLREQIKENEVKELSEGIKTILKGENHE